MDNCRQGSLSGWRREGRCAVTSRARPRPSPRRWTEPGGRSAAESRCGPGFWPRITRRAFPTSTWVLASDPNSVDAYLNRSAARRATGDAAGADADIATGGRARAGQSGGGRTSAASRGSARATRPGPPLDFTRTLELNPAYLVVRVNRAAARIELGDSPGRWPTATMRSGGAEEPRRGREPRHRPHHAQRLRRRGQGCRDDHCRSIPMGSKGCTCAAWRARDWSSSAPRGRSRGSREAAPTLAAAWAVREREVPPRRHRAAVADYREAFRLDAAFRDVRDRRF